MTPEAFLYAAIVLGIFVAVLYVATIVVSGRFFSALIAKRPELAKKFPPLPDGVTMTGPIRSAQMNYLLTGSYRTIADPDIKRAGSSARIIVVAYVVSSLACLFCLLSWKVLQELA